MPTALTELIQKHQPVLVLTGAGISTASGIPAYRDDTGQWMQPKPVQAQEFRAHETVRQRYWQRSMAGWPNFHQALPNATHNTLAELENAGVVSAVITQNVDGLHDRASSRNVIELHGGLSEVICLQCGDISRRDELQGRLENDNRQFIGSTFETRADGDADITLATIPTDEFKVPCCLACDGMLKPNVVFFGENVPTQRVEKCITELQAAAMLLCIGTSLAVFSGFRFCRAAHQAGQPIALINQGATRADALATVIVNDDCALTLKLVQQNLKSAAP